MTLLAKAKKIISKVLVILLIVSQFAFVGNLLLAPKPAQAFWGIGDFTFNTEVANWYDIFKDIGIAVAQRIAISYANKYLTRFVDKVIDKYRIKDYLAYDKVLSGYYLNQYIYQNVSDPDLRAIYGLLATDINTRAQVAPPGVNCSATPEKCKPVLAALKEKLDTYYISRGGIDSNLIYNPGASVTDEQYFAAAQAYFSNPPSFTEQNLYGQFGQQVADSQRAAALELGNSAPGLKNDRSNPTGTVDRYCDGGSRAPDTYTDNGKVVPYPSDPITNQAACISAGGEWKVDTLGITQSVIQNPSGFIHDFATSGIKEIFSSNFGARDNLYTTIGSLLGNFLFTRLNLVGDKKSNGSDGTLNEKGPDYVASTGFVPMVKNIDLDADNIPDGQDTNGDELLSTPGEDTCYHGGVAPNCKVSTSVVSSPYFTPICQSIDNAVSSLTEYNRFIVKYSTGTDNQLRDEENFINKADADVWARRTGEANSAMDDIVNAIQNYHSSYFDNLEFSVGRYNVFLSSVLQSLQKDKDLDLSSFAGNGGGGLTNLKRLTADVLRYLVDVKQAIGKCENPNLKAAGDVPPPIIVDPGEGETGPTCDDDPTAQACTSPDYTEIVRQVKSYLVSRGQQFNNYCDAFEIVKRVAWTLRSEGVGLLTTFHTTQCNGFSADVVAFPDGSGADILGNAGAPPADGGPYNIPQWGPMPDNPEPGVDYAPATDPGDPGSACYISRTCP